MNIKLINIMLFLILSSTNFAIAGESEDYTFAYKLFKDEVYSVAKDQFYVFIEKYKESKHADDARFLIAESALRLRKYDEALQNYERLLTDHPESSLRLDAVRGTANAWYHQGKYEEAIKGYEKVLESATEPELISESLYLTGESYDSLGLYQKASQFYDRLLSEYPNATETADAIYSKAWTSYRLRRYRSAHKLLSKFVEDYPEHYAVAEASYRSAEALFKLGEWADALTNYQSFVENYKDESAQRKFIVSARFRIGECYFQQKMMIEAKNMFVELLYEGNAQEISAEAQYWIAEILVEEKKYDKAVYEYEKVIELHPNSDVADNAQYGISMIYFQQKDYVQAREGFKEVADNPRSELADAARFRMAEASRLVREFNTAILSYRKVQSNSTYADDAIYQMGLCYFELRDYARSVEAFNQLLTTYPNSNLKVYVFYHMGLAFFNDKKYIKSSDVFELYFENIGSQNLETTPPDEALFWQARANYEVKRYAETIEKCTKLLKEYEESSHRSEAKFLIAESTYWAEPTLRGIEAARKIYSELLNSQTAQEWIEKSMYGLGWTYLSEAILLLKGKKQNNNYRKAIEVWRSMVEKYPSGDFAAQAQYQIGVALSNLRQYGKAIEAFEVVLSDYPESDKRDNAKYQIGWARYKLERYLDAMSDFHSFIRKYPDSPLKMSAMFGTANSRFRLGDYPQAIAEYKKVVNLSPPHQTSREAGTSKIIDLRPEAQYYIAESYMNLQRTPEAIDAYKKLLKKYPSSEWADDAQYSIATAYDNMGQKEKALGEYRKLVKNYPSSSLAPDVQIQIGRSYHLRKKYQKAIAEYREVVRKYGDTSIGWRGQFHIGESHLAMREYEKAMETFRKVSPKSELAPRAGYEIGYSLYDRNNPKRDLNRAAMELLKVPREYPGTPSSPRALLLAGKCYQELSEFSKAVKVYREIISRYPNSDSIGFAQLSLGHSYRSMDEAQLAIDAYSVIRDGGMDRYRVGIVVEAVMYLAETLTQIGKHNDAGATYLRVPLLYQQYDALSAMNATTRAANAYMKAGEFNMARDILEDAIKLYQEKISSAKNAEKQEWDKLYRYARSKHKQLVLQLEQRQ